ncbi:MAG: hypothetical protein ABH867_03260 [Patescibacteria group bacterium]|nr:hypothetical protein [Patescibacteria group bacterium]
MADKKIGVKVRKVIAFIYEVCFYMALLIAFFFSFYKILTYYGIFTPPV